jgi:formate C-acetyltransferase
MAITKDKLTYGIKPYNEDWGTGVSGMDAETASPFERIRNWRKEFLDTPLTLDEERAVLWTEALKGNEDKPQIIRNAEALAYVLDNIQIHIGDYELILGNMAAPPRCAPVFPEFSYEWMLDELENAPFNERDGDRFEYNEKTKENLMSLAKFWKDQTVHDLAKNLMSEEELKGTGGYGKGVYLLGNYFYGGVGHCSPRYEKLLDLGWKGIRELVEKNYAKIDMTDPEGIKKAAFYRAELISVDAIMNYIKRYAQFAREKAEAESGARKEELMQMADNCEWISENPPRNFWEAMQMWWFITVTITIEGNGHSIAYGRFDQYMYPFYKNDLKEGTFSKEFMQELIECGWIKISELTKIRDAGSTAAFGGVELGGPSLTLGGVTPDGDDATNDLSFMGVDALAHVRLHAPWITTRHHIDEPKEWMLKCTKVAKMGFGLPSFFNDEVIIPSMLNRGRKIEDCRDYNALGCVEPDAGGREYGWHDAAFFNMNKVLELAINNGKCINCSSDCPIYANCVGAGSQLGLETGSLAEFETFAEVEEAYEKQMEYWVDRLTAALNSCDIAHMERKPLPYLSLLIEDCIDKGVDVTRGGARYNFIGPQGVGVANVADGLANIKYLVFDEKEISGEDFLEALENNWEGYEPIYAKANSSNIPHYGNDNDYADTLAKYGANVYCKEVEERPAAHGGIFQPGLYPVSANVPHGAMQAATPDGRKAGEAVADGVSPVHTSRASHDISGPTAVFKSVSSLDHARASNGTLLNTRFAPSTLEGETGDENFMASMRVYFERKGMHNQINVISSEVLKDAMENPEKYKGLIVRVAGYSAFFTELDSSLQKDLIERTEMSY